MKSTAVVFRVLLLSSFVILISQIALAQPPPPPDPTIPIDGGITLLLAAGIGYGVKKIYGKRNTAK